MKTTITYNIPDSKIVEILFMLGYTPDMPCTKEDFMNEVMKKAVVGAVSMVFTDAKTNMIEKMKLKIPEEVHATVEQMLSITTV
jgi:hypothetical protein